MNHKHMKLGKKPFTGHKPSTLHLHNYLSSPLPTPPGSVNYTHGIKDWGVMLNDKEGDCTCAACGHMIMSWTANNHSLVTPSDSSIQDMYVSVTGLEGAAFNPITGDNDNGCVPEDVLGYWRNYGLAGNKIVGFAAVQPYNVTQVKLSIDLFGSLYLGLSLPLSAQRQNDTWSVTKWPLRGSSTRGSWGGHAVPVLRYNSETLTVVTWGGLMKMTWNFLRVYADEAYVVLDEDWLSKAGVSPSGLNIQQLQTDLGLL